MDGQPNYWTDVDWQAMVMDNDLTQLIVDRQTKSEGEDDGQWSEEMTQWQARPSPGQTQLDGQWRWTQAQTQPGRRRPVTQADQPNPLWTQADQTQWPRPSEPSDSDPLIDWRTDGLTQTTDNWTTQLKLTQLTQTQTDQTSWRAQWPRQWRRQLTQPEPARPGPHWLSPVIDPMKALTIDPLRIGRTDSDGIDSWQTQTGNDSEWPTVLLKPIEPSDEPQLTPDGPMTVVGIVVIGPVIEDSIVIGDPAQLWPSYWRQLLDSEWTSWQYWRTQTSPANDGYWLTVDNDEDPVEWLTSQTARPSPDGRTRTQPMTVTRTHWVIDGVPSPSPGPVLVVLSDSGRRHWPNQWRTEPSQTDDPIGQWKPNWRTQLKPDPSGRYWRYWTNDGPGQADGQTQTVVDGPAKTRMTDPLVNRRRTDQPSQPTRKRGRPQTTQPDGIGQKWPSQPRPMVAIEAQMTGRRMTNDIVWHWTTWPSIDPAQNDPMTNDGQ